MLPLLASSFSSFLSFVSLLLDFSTTPRASPADSLGGKNAIKGTLCRVFRQGQGGSAIYIYTGTFMYNIAVQSKVNIKIPLHLNQHESTRKTHDLVENPYVPLRAFNPFVTQLNRKISRRVLPEKKGRNRPAVTGASVEKCTCLQQKCISAIEMLLG